MVYSISVRIFISYLCFLMICVLFPLSAQDARTRVLPPEAGIKTTLDRTFERLDKSRIAAGILHDKVLSLGNIEAFTGSGQISPANLKQWQQLYFEMYQASLDRPNFPALNTLKSRAKPYIKRSIVPIGIINFQYNKIKENALEDGLLTIENERLIDSGNSTISPYETRQLFAVSALKTHTYHNTVTFLIDRQFFVSNLTEPLHSLEINFDDGSGFRRVEQGSQITINYGISGSKQIHIKANYAQKPLEAQFGFTIRQFNKTAVVNEQPDIIWEGLVADEPYLGESAVYDLYTFLGNGNSQITKPILFVEGFDIGDILGWEEIYALLNQQNLAPTLLAAGYDITIMNFGDATDYIQRNGFALVSAIERIKMERSGSEPLIVAGASMGGLVGRFGLAWMENNAMDHETRIFLSFDSPQQSANLPLGIQHWAVFFAELDANAGALIEELNSPGAQQMLVYHHLNAPDVGNNALRDELFTDLAALGNYPSNPNLRKIAIANGSGAGASAGQTGNGDILSLIHI